MHAKPYPEAKRRILLERSVEDFVVFLEEVTESQGTTFIRNQLLPRTVTGFRPGHAPLALTVPKLISNLSDEQELTNLDSPIWDMFKNAWICWVGSHRELNEILLEFDNSVDFDENHNCIAPPNSELDIQCFNTLLDASREYLIDQETIRRFYVYGYFNEDEQIEELIDRALPLEEIERRQQIEQLPDQVDRLRQEIEELHTQISNLEIINELEQVLDQRIAEVQQSFENQFSQLNVSQNVRQLKQSIESLKSRLHEVENSLKSRIDTLENSQTETDSAINDFVDHTEKTTAQLEQQRQNTNQSVSEQLDRMNSVVTEITAQIEQQRQSIDQSVSEQLSGMDSAIAEIRSEVEAQNQSSNRSANVTETLEIENREAGAPRIAHKALRIGESFASRLKEKNEHYQDENDYLSDFQYSLNRYGITDSDEIAAAIHVALKAFPAMEITDTRIFKIWNLMCDKHLLYTNLNVEMGWLGFQDWFPYLLADECLGERLERIDLEISIQKMLDMGKMLWAIYFKNCDRSFPECYLQPFIKWIKGFSDSTIKIFLTRCSGKNRCEITEDAYALMARLPEPEEEEPIEAQNLRTSGIIITQSEWDAWCQPPSDVDQSLQNQFDIVNQLRSIINENGVRTPKTPLREIMHYLRLSQSIKMEPTRALDWALTMRLLPWIEKQPNIIENVLRRISQEYDDLEHFNEALQIAHEKINESN